MKIIYAVIRKLCSRVRHPDDVRKNELTIRCVMPPLSNVHSPSILKKQDGRPSSNVCAEMETELTVRDAVFFRFSKSRPLNSSKDAIPSRTACISRFTHSEPASFCFAMNAIIRAVIISSARIFPWSIVIFIVLQVFRHRKTHASALRGELSAVGAGEGA